MKNFKLGLEKLKNIKITKGTRIIIKIVLTIIMEIIFSYIIKNFKGAIAAAAGVFIFNLIIIIWSFNPDRNSGRSLKNKLHNKGKEMFSGGDGTSEEKL